MLILERGKSSEYIMFWTYWYVLEIEVKVL